MAQLNVFKCSKCGYEIMANKNGYDRFMTGWRGYYSCKYCKEIISLSIPEITFKERGVKALYRVLGEIEPCHKCGRMDLKPWTYKSKCPKCGGDMISDNMYILAD